MSNESLIEVLRAHLAKEGLVLCKLVDTQFPIDGFKESQALRDIVELIDDTQRVAEWDHDTTPIPADLLAELRRAS